MGAFRGLNAKNAGIDGMDVVCEGLEVMVYVLWVGDENIRDGGRTADGIWSDGGRSTMTEVEVLGYIGGVMGEYILCYGVIYIILWSCIYYAMGLYIYNV